MIFYKVFDLDEDVPEKVLCKLYLTLKDLELHGDELAIKIQKQLRVIVAGGDGTAAWLLRVVSDLKLSYPPPIATVPLGTVNNLPFAFGWGKKNPGTDRESVLKFLELVLEGKEMEVDSWHILMRRKSDCMNPIPLPHSFSSVDNKLNVSGYDTFCGGFWTYFSMGVEAQVTYEFHCERKLHPEKFKNQLANLSTYAKIGSTKQGFFASYTLPSSMNIAQLMKVKIMQRHGGWIELKVHESIRSIICLNLPSFSGGLNPWGTPNLKIAFDRDLTSPYVDDGLIEIVGFKDSWNGRNSRKGYGTRLAQTNRVRFELFKGAADFTYMQMDGEPWKQPLPVDDDTTVVEISHNGRVKMLATQNCILNSIYDPSPSRSHEEDIDDSENEDAPRGEE